MLLQNVSFYHATWHPCNFRQMIYVDVDCMLYLASFFLQAAVSKVFGFRLFVVNFIGFFMPVKLPSWSNTFTVLLNGVHTFIICKETQHCWNGPCTTRSQCYRNCHHEHSDRWANVSVSRSQDWIVFLSFVHFQTKEPYAHNLHRFLSKIRTNGRHFLCRKLSFLCSSTCSTWLIRVSCFMHANEKTKNNYLVGIILRLKTTNYSCSIEYKHTHTQKRTAQNNCIRWKSFISHWNISIIFSIATQLIATSSYRFCLIIDRAGKCRNRRW